MRFSTLHVSYSFVFTVMLKKQPQPLVVPRAKSSRMLVLLMAVTVFVSAFLLFQVQPLISKLILPWFGGSPTVWTIAMLFFQCALFAGYGYSHLVTRYLPFRTHLKIHVALLVVSAVMSMLILPRDSFKPHGDENPALRILLLLSVCVGLPYVTLASTGPIVQAWFARVCPGQSPYRLYSLSNVGSFLALLSFPYLFEPYFQLPELGRAWTAIYWVFAGCCGGTSLWLMRHTSLPEDRWQPSYELDVDQGEKPSWVHRSLWVALPALASLTMIAATDHVSHNVAPEPRLWITTLGLYLLTFIITFEHERWYQRTFVAAACLAAIVLLTGKSEVLDWVGLDWSFGVSELRWSHFAVMFLICFLCHGELVRLRPMGAKYLTEFYLCISAGGACGGIFASIVAVNLFDDFYEWPLCLVVASIAAIWIVCGSRPSRYAKVVAIDRRSIIACGVSLLAIGWIGYMTDPFQWRSADSGDYQTTHLYRGRNFYGAISVEDEIHRSVPSKSFRGFYSGNVTHGMQLSLPEEHLRPVSYYGATSGAGETILYAQRRQSSLRIAVVGLGAGSLASYGRATDQFDFYEINPEVIRVAETYFTFLSECKASTHIFVGDGRLKIQESPHEPYDIILLDAFTGGSVPVHLLTQEAFAMYREHLAEDGFLVVHITNAYLELYPIVKLQAKALGMGYRSKFEAYDRGRMVRRNHYMTITNDSVFLDEFPSVYPPIYDEKETIIDRKEPEVAGATLWTDHFSSINSIERDD